MTSTESQTAATTAIADANAKASARAASGTNSIAASSVASALAIIVIFHVNQALGAFHMTTLPPEVAGQYQMLIQGLAIWWAHSKGIQ